MPTYQDDMISTGHDQAHVPLSIFRSNAKFDENSKHYCKIYAADHNDIVHTCVQNIVVIGRVYSKLERSEFSSNFEFDRNMLSGTGAVPIGIYLPVMGISIIKMRQSSEHLIFIMWTPMLLKQTTPKVAIYSVRNLESIPRIFFLSLIDQGLLTKEI